MRLSGIILFLFLSLNVYAHKHYISITEIEWKAESGVFEASLKLTAHDFEHMLEDEGLSSIHIEKMKEGDEHYKKTLSILTRDFRVYTGEEQCEIQFVGWEVTTDDQLFLYLKFVPQTKIDFNEVTISQNILFAKFSQQQNIVHFKHEDEVKSETLITDKASTTFKL